MTDLITDETLAYHLSLQDELMSVMTIARKYGLTSERSMAISKAAFMIKSARLSGEEVWNLIEVKLPPPFREILFSDGHAVFSGIVSSIITKEEELKDNLLRLSKTVYNKPKWWREMPYSPWEVYGI